MQVFLSVCNVEPVLYYQEATEFYVKAQILFLTYLYIQIYFPPFHFLHFCFLLLFYCLQRELLRKRNTKAHEIDLMVAKRIFF